MKSQTITKARNLLAELNATQRGQCIARTVVHYIIKGWSMDDAIQDTKELSYYYPHLFTDKWIDAHATLSHVFADEMKEAGYAVFNLQ